MPEPHESAVHLLSHALGLDWGGGNSLIWSRRQLGCGSVAAPSLAAAAAAARRRDDNATAVAAKAWLWQRGGATVTAEAWLLRRRQQGGGGAVPSREACRHTGLPHPRLVTTRIYFSKELSTLVNVHKVYKLTRDSM